MPGDSAYEKEPSYFSFNYQQSWRQYKALFDAAPSDALLGEASQSYCSPVHGANARDRIEQRFPQIKWLIIARDPLDRIRASYREMHHSGINYGQHCPYSIDEMLRRWLNVMADSRYWTRLSVLRESVPDERILVILLEDLIKDPQSVLHRCFEFLGVDADIVIPHQQRKLNKGSSKLYDSKRLRHLRRMQVNPETAKIMKRIPQPIQDQFLSKLGLRKTFGHDPLPWSDESMQTTAALLADESKRFLQYIGRDLAVWKSMSAALKTPVAQSVTHLKDKQLTLKS